MNKDNSTPDDDFADDDFDLEASDESTGDFDDFDDAEWEEEFSEAAPADEKMPKAKKHKKEKIAPMAGDGLPRQRSFFSRYFNIILIVAVALLGGGYFLLKMSRPPASPAPSETAGDFTSGKSALPAAPADGTDLSAEAPPVAPPAKVEDEFTTDDSGKMSDMEKDMAASIDQAPPMPAPINSVPEDLDIKKPQEPETKPDMPKQAANGIEQEALLPLSAASVPEAPVAPVPAPQVETPAPVAVAAAPVVTPAPVAAPAVDTQVVQKMNDLVEAQAKKIDELENKIAKLEKEMAGKTQDTNAKISDVSTSLAALKAKVSSIQTAAPRETPAAVSAAPVYEAPPKAATPAPAPKIKSLIPEETAAAPVTAAPSAPVATTKAFPRWELRFAQPGKAMLAQKGSSDFRTVETGDSLAGVGKITSIAQENGRWVVRGTQGSVSQ